MEFLPDLSASPNIDQLIRLYQAEASDNCLLALHSEFFERERPLGRGGMGLVQQVLDKRLGRSAALKTLQSDNDQMEARFLREAQITARLDHPAIPPIYELGRTPHGQLYLLMRVIKGETLADKIRQYHEENKEETTLRTLLEVVVKSCEAVAYAHSHGIIHRDLKPENIMVGAFGEVLVMDWGLAKDTRGSIDDHLSSDHLGMSETLNITQVGSVLGTLGYMPPEQADDSQINEQADVFSIGAILTCILTGRPPIDGPSNINRLNATLKGQLELPSDRVQVAPDLNFIVASALQIDRDHRSQSIMHISGQLQEFLNGDEVTGYQYPLKLRAQKVIKKHPERLLFLLGFLSLIFCLSSLGLYQKYEGDRAEAETRQKLLEQENAIEKQKLENQRIENRAAEAERSRRLLSLLEQGRELIGDASNRAKTEKILAQALELGQHSRALLLTVASIYKYGRWIEKQEQCLKEIVKRYPPATDVLYQLHLLQIYKQHKEPSPTKWSQRIIDQSTDPSKTNIFVELSRSLEMVENEDYEEALENYNTIEKKETIELPSFFNDRGLLHLRKKGKANARLAAADFSRAIQIDPNYSRAFANRGRAHLQLKMDSESLEDLSRAIALDNADWFPLLMRANMLFNMRELNSAERDVNKAIKLTQGKEASCYGLRASIYNRKNNHYSQNRDLGRFYYLRGQFQDAINSLSRAIPLDRRNLDALYYRAQAHNSLNQRQAAIADLKEVVSRAKPTTIVYKKAANLMKSLDNAN